MSETTGNFAAALDKEENGFAIVEGNEYVQHERTPPKSHSCCGCCCDTRRAVVVVNIISMTFAALAIVSLSVVVNGQYAAQFDDDEVQAALEEIDGTAVGITIGLACLGIACNTAGIIGALKFNKFAIVAAGLWYFAECIRACWFFDLVGLIMAAFFMYPHVVFYQEINKGIMTSEKYPDESQCCNCCV